MADLEHWAESIESCLIHHVRDWGEEKRDAWLYGVIMGYDDECMAENRERFGWSDETCARLTRLHEQYVTASQEGRQRPYIGEPVKE